MFQIISTASKLLPKLLTPNRSVVERCFCKTKSKWHRHPSSCSLFPYASQEPRPCFDISKVLVETGGKCHEKLIRSFLYAHYWPREPSTVSLYMPLCSPYLSVLTERYATTGDRFLAFEIQPRTKERKLIGVLVADKASPWTADEYEEWAQFTCLKPERHDMYFRAHCLRIPNLFDKYHVPYVYNIEVLATSSEVSGQGVAELLLRTCIVRALELRHPLIQIVSKSAYTHGLCARVGMKLEWEMKYSELVDMAGQSVFYPRNPHQTVALFVKKFELVPGSIIEKWKDPEMYKVFKRAALTKKTPHTDSKICTPPFPEFRLFPRCQT